jgi:fused signal recognition particle receptor
LKSLAMVGHGSGADKSGDKQLAGAARGQRVSGTDVERSSVSGSVSEEETGGGFWRRLKTSLNKTRGQLAEGVGTLLLGQKEIDDSVMEELETALLLTDVGIETTQHIMGELAQRVKRQELNNTVALHGALGRLLKDLLQPLSRPFEIPADQRPFVVFFVGVNGVGKTTTIGKMARLLSDEGHTVMLAAGDTFRAAAVEQLKSWGDRAGVPVIAQGQGADSASVVFDAVQAAGSRGIDVLLADTAGRLQAKTNLMEELRKVKRVVSRLDARAPHQVLLVLDAGIGQNAISQVREFDAAVGVTGLVITKLDGTAKAGVLFAIARQVAKPVYFIGIGEGVEDLKPFSASDFVDALLARE